MTADNCWLLPDGIEEVLPPHALRLELLCRQLIDLHTSWGYELVMPPLLEYLESLLTGTGQDLDIKTFKLTDQLSGRLMGIRSDITPQVTRIDAHVLRRTVPTRLCYVAPVVHTKPAHAGISRAPLQMGAELYGYAGLSADLEILALMIASLQQAGIAQMHLTIGHVGIFKGLINYLGFNIDMEQSLLDILSKRASADLEYFCQQEQLSAEHRQLLQDFMQCNGSPDVLIFAREKLHCLGAKVLVCLDELLSIADAISAHANVTIDIDLSELRGYGYHTGIVYSVYTPGMGEGIAFGGRYDAIGEAFGRARPATGFSTNARLLLQLHDVPQPAATRIFAPFSSRADFTTEIARLRTAGAIVICELPAQTGDAKAMGCDSVLRYQNSGWQVLPLSKDN